MFPPRCGHKLNVRVVVEKDATSKPVRHVLAANSRNGPPARPARQAPPRDLPTLPWRPTKGPPAQQMQMQMKNRLPRPASIIQYCAIPFEKLQFSRQLRRHQLQLAEHRLICGSGFIKRSKMFAWAD